MSFESLGLSPAVLQAVADAGYTDPTPIQAQAIPYVLMGRDVLGCAQTGTGKTAGFTLPMIDILASGRAKARMPRSLILEPTRELAAQVAENFDVYGKHNKLSMALLIGGVSFDDQERVLDRGVDVLIATPGRLLDHFERGKVLLNDVKLLVIDEADRMLDMGFIPDVERIVSLIPRIRQTLFFSATMPPEIRRLADAFLMNPKEISVAPPATASATVIQGLAVVGEADKREALRRLIRKEQVRNAIIFCNRKRDVDILHKSLKRHGFNAGALHGDMSQPMRMETLERFRNGEIQLLIASDVAARGLDVDDMSHVFNFDVPIHADDYIHRIGRTARAGKSGVAYTLATPDDGEFVAAIEKLTGMSIPRIEVPDMAALGLEDGGGRRRRGRGGQRGGPGRREGRPDHPRRDRGPRRVAAEAEQPSLDELVPIDSLPDDMAPAPPQAAAVEAGTDQPRGRDGDGRRRRRGGRDRNGAGDDRPRQPRERHHRNEEPQADEIVAAAPSADADEPPQPQRHESDPGERPRDARREGRRDGGHEGQREARPEGRDEPRSEGRHERRREGRHEGRHERRLEPRPDERDGTGRREAARSQDDRRHRNRDRDLGPPVLGMGDHTPAFLLQKVPAHLARNGGSEDESTPPVG